MKTSTSAAKSAKKRPAQRSGKSSIKSQVPKLIYAHASPLSVGGVSMFEAQQQINSHTLRNFFSEPEVIDRAVEALQRAGFSILQVSPTTINISGSPQTFQSALNTKIVAEEREVIKGGHVKDTATFLDSPDTETPGLLATRGTQLGDLIEGIALEEPRYYFAPSMFAPLKSYWHLRLPGDVSLATNADRAHRSGITGRGIRVAMADSGHYKHPYFVGRGYRVAPVVLGPGAVNPLADEVGHGTGESANIFAVAPDVNFMPVKMSFVNTIAAFNTTVGLKPDIITCSWGSSNPNGPLSAADQALAAAIAAAVSAGIVVVFSAGNGHWGFPGQHPDVISAGGTFMNPDESLTASNYASGFASNIYPGRNVPDLCGLVGKLPKAIYLMLPLESGDQIDVGNAGSAYPNGDETSDSDGWAGFSGTSAAAPQLAGAAALIKQACPSLTPQQVREILIKSARDVTTGTCNPSTGGNAAGPGPDLATGAGLVDAYKAVLLAKLKCGGPIKAVIPPISVHPPIAVKPPITVPPVKPPITVKPPIGPPITPPIVPILPVKPIKPIIPIEPIRPIVPIEPVEPIEPGPARPEDAAMSASGEGNPGLSVEDVQALEDMIVNSDFDPNP